MKFVSALDDGAQLLIVNEGSANVDISNHCYAKTVEFLWPVVDVNSLMADYQSIRFNQERPEHYYAEKQDEDVERNAQPLGPTRSVTPSHRTGRTPHLAHQKQKQPEND